MEKALKRLISQYGSGDPELPLFSGDTMPKTFVVTIKKNDGVWRTLLKSYGKSPSEISIETWEAARATAAAPFYFKPMQIGRQSYIDGGLGWNNPTEEAIFQARKLWGNTRTIGCVVSIGTGEEAELDYKYKKCTKTHLRAN